MISFHIFTVWLKKRAVFTDCKDMVVPKISHIVKMKEIKLVTEY